jgi:hypothetical protein
MEGRDYCNLPLANLRGWAHYTLPFSFNWKSLVIVAFTGGGGFLARNGSKHLCVIKLSIETLKLKGVHELRYGDDAWSMPLTYDKGELERLET